MIVWNDPVNLMSYVTYVFQKLFGYSRTKAESAHDAGAQRGQGGGVGRQRAPKPKATSPACTPTACGRPSSRIADAVARRYQWFTRRRDGMVTVRLRPDEAMLLVQVTNELRTLLDCG